ncbi:MAG: DVU_1553 family AMP-dependent CoA ligase [Terracidiphilus sp.]
MVLNLTERCNLACQVCFASAGESPRPNSSPDPTFDEVLGWCRNLLKDAGPFNLHLSGGEPTLRDDLPQLIRAMRDLGFTYLQLNTNGIRLAEGRSYAEELKKAGLSRVFLQFDDVSDDVFLGLRGRPLLETKLRAIEHCGSADLGVVLVPTLVPRVNTGQIGQILRTALGLVPTVRTVHFQPVSYFGRYPHPPADRDRITIPEIVAQIEEQTGGKFKAANFYPASGENPYCSFHGRFWLHADGRIVPTARPAQPSCCGAPQTPLIQLGAALCRRPLDLPAGARARRRCAGPLNESRQLRCLPGREEAQLLHLGDGLPGCLEPRPRPAARLLSACARRRRKADPALRLEPHQPRRSEALPGSCWHGTAWRRAMNATAAAIRRSPLDAWMAGRLNLAPSDLSRRAIAAYQLDALRQTLDWARTHSAFCRECLAALDSSPFGDLADLRKIPFTTPADLVQHGARMLCLPQDRISRIVTLNTSGTTGSAKRVFFTSEDQERALEYFAAGVTAIAAPGEIMLIALPGETEGSVGRQLAMGIARAGVEPIPYGPIHDPAHALALIEARRIDSIIGFPVQILALARHPDKRLAGALRRMRSIVLCCDHVPQSLVEALHELTGCEIFEHYGSTEMGLGGGVDCAAHAGYHLREADLLLETISPKPASPRPRARSARWSSPRSIAPACRSSAIAPATFRACCWSGARAARWWRASNAFVRGLALSFLSPCPVL